MNQLKKVMKNLLLSSIIIGILLSCSNDDESKNVVNPQLIGKWKLIETFLDPGDGSGTYQSIESEKTIEFFNNGTFAISGSLCKLSTSVGEITMGIVSESKYSDRNILISNEECDPDNSTAEYRLSIDNSDLIVSYTACIEGCGLKYQKLITE